MRVAVYIRVSSDKQAKEGDSIPAQIAALHKYISDTPGMILHDDYIDDGISGTKFSERDELQRMLSDVQAEKIDIIIFTKLDRFYRSIRHYTATQEVLDKHGVTWLAVWEPVYNTTTPAGRLIVNQMMSIAQFEAENTGQRIKAVFDFKSKKGEVLSGNQPFGFRIRDKRLAPGEHADDVRSIFEHYSMHGNLRETARFASQFDGAPRCASALKNLLRNEKYIGVFRDNPDYCEPIIDKALFDDVQRKLSINIKISQKHTYIFSGLCRCAECGAVMGANRRIKPRKSHDYVEITYRCPHHYQRAGDYCENAKALNENVLERYLLDNVKQMAEGYVREWEIIENPKEDIKKKQRTIEAKLKRLKDLYVDGLISIDEYKADRLALDAEMSSLRTEPEKDLTELRELLKMDIRSIYGTFSREEKRYFWRAVVKEIRFGKSKRIDVLFF